MKQKSNTNTATKAHFPKQKGCHLAKIALWLSWLMFVGFIFGTTYHLLLKQVCQGRFLFNMLIISFIFVSLNNFRKKIIWFNFREKQRQHLLLYLSEGSQDEMGTG